MEHEHVNLPLCYLLAQANAPSSAMSLDHWHIWKHADPRNRVCPISHGNCSIEPVDRADQRTEILDKACSVTALLHALENIR